MNFFQVVGTTHIMVNMYVRWKKRPETRHGRKISATPARYEKEKTGLYHLSAYLVESKRIDCKPRQKDISYLGSISERHLRDYNGGPDRWPFSYDEAVSAIDTFWVKVEDALNNLCPDMDRGAKKKIIASLNKVVPTKRPRKREQFIGTTEGP